MTTVEKSALSVEPKFHVLSWSAGERHQGSSTLHTKNYRRRHPHPKTKTGCLACKVKRVKCDEARPRCKRCSRNKRHCVYVRDTIKESDKIDDTVSPFVLHHKPFDRYAVYLPASLQHKLALPPVRGYDPTMLLHHFNDARLSLILPGPIDATSMIPLALGKPHLLHAILAVSASHLRNHTIGSNTSWQAESSQLALSAQKLQVALQQPLDQASSDALLLCSMLLNLLAFSSADGSGPSPSWALTDDMGGLWWFRLQLGLTTLLYATRTFHGQGSILHDMFEASNTEPRVPKELLDDYDTVPEHWLHLCEMGNPSPCLAETYCSSLKSLAVLRQLKPLRQSFMLHLKAFGNFDMDFYHALVNRDPAALWILGYWLGLLCRYDIWWVKIRALKDYVGITNRLRHVGLANETTYSGLMWTRLLQDLKSASESII